MTGALMNGDILTLQSGSRRMVYLGDGIANVESYIPERSKTGGLTNSGKGKWIVDSYYPQHRNVKLTQQQIDFWISKKEALTA